MKDKNLLQKFVRERGAALVTRMWQIQVKQQRRAEKGFFYGIYPYGKTLK